MSDKGENLGRHLSNGGPRVTSGEESKQDYATPDDFIKAVESRFGPIQFDLAAHASNKKHERYLAPSHLVTTGTAEELKISKQGVDFLDTHTKMEMPDIETVIFIKKVDKKRGKIYEKSVVNRDPNAFGFDAFAHSWAKMSQKFPMPKTGKPGLGWLNCEFNDCERWSARSFLEMEKGANLTLLTPAVVANWWRDNCAGKADCYLLSGRLCFDGKNVYPKDCCLSHFSPEARGRLYIWEWKSDTLHQGWIPEDRVIQWD